VIIQENQLVHLQLIEDAHRIARVADVGEMTEPPGFNQTSLRSSSAGITRVLASDAREVRQQMHPESMAFSGWNCAPKILACAIAASEVTP